MRYFKFTATLLSALLLLSTGSVALAQQSLSSSSAETEAAETQVLDSPEAVRELVSRLSDNEVRSLLLERLDAVAAEQAANDLSSDFTLFSLITTIIPTSVLAAVNSLPDMLSGQKQIIQLFTESLGPNGLIKLLLAFLIAICAGLIVEFVVRGLSRKWRTTVDNSVSSEHSLQDTLKLLSLRFVLDLSGLLAFIFVTQIVLRQLTDSNVQFFMHTCSLESGTDSKAFLSWPEIRIRAQTARSQVDPHH